MIRKFQTHEPRIRGWVADSADVIGNVEIQKDASVFFQAVLRGDNHGILIKEGSNIQDGCILHTDAEHKLEIGRYVSVGHGCILHGCCIEDNVLIGMGAIIMNGAHIGENTIIGAGSLVSEHKTIPPNSVVYGSPVSTIRQISEEQKQMIRKNAQHYIALARVYQEEKR